MMSSTKEGMVLGGSRRRGTTGPKAGSVWESRMKLDQVKGGIRVFDTTHEVPEPSPRKSSAGSSPEPQMDKKLNNGNDSNARAKQGIVGLSGKRKTWKSETPEGSPNIIQIAKQRSESGRNLDQQLKEISVCADEAKNSRSEDVKIEEGGDSDLKKMKSEQSDGNSVDQLVTVLEKKVPDGKKITNSVTDEPNKLRSDHQHCEEKKAYSSNVGRQIKTSSDGEEAGLDGDEEQDKKLQVQSQSLDIKEDTSRELQKPKKFVVEEKKSIQSNAKPPNLSAKYARIRPIPTKSNANNYSHGIPRTNGKLQSFVDLVMWRDVSKSAFVFGIGTFAIISSSFTKDLNISFISVVSYLGLVYLSANFLFKSLAARGSMEMNGSNQEYVVGEEDAIWAIKLFLPYVNEFLVNLRALFSGDPTTTMKLAVLLFVLAQCGSSITIWKMIKLGFFGLFIVPKVCSSYSSQITAYGMFWMRRFADAWKSCSHKKVVGFVVFTLVWNLASIVARVWIVFMLLVTLKYYQKTSGHISEETTHTDNYSWQRNARRSPALADTGKQNKER